MIDYETQRKLIVVFILAVILVVIGSIIALIFIWIPDNDKNENKPQEVGKVERKTVTKEDIIKKYYNDLFVIFANNDEQKIYSLVSQDYLDYNKYTKDDIINYLRSKNVLGQILDLVQYQAHSVSGYTNVYYMDLKVKNQAYSINIILKEKSPNNYTIAFDNFIDYKENTYSNIVNSVQLEVKGVTRYVNSVEYEFKLTNKYNKKITLSSGSEVNNIILVNSNSEVKKPFMTTLPITEYVINAGDSREYTVVFNIEDVTDYITYNTLVIKNIGFEGIVGTKNLEYKIN